MKKLLISAAMLTLSGAAQAGVYTVPNDVSAGHMNMRNGPGTNHSLVGAIPAGMTVTSSRCTPRDDGITGADWCLVTWNGVTGWVSSAGLMPGYMPPSASAPVPVPQGTIIQGEPPLLRGQQVSPDYYGTSIPTPRVDAQFLTCTPPLDRNDKNPVKNIFVSFEYDMTSRRFTSMNVTHERYYGDIIDRFQQYPNAVLKFDGSIYGWTGAWVKNPARTMAGGVYMGQDGRWYYREKGWMNGASDSDMIAACKVSEGE